MEPKKKPWDWLYLIQRSDPFFPGAVSGVELENLHCQQSKCLLGVCAGSAARSSPVSASWPDWAPFCCFFSPICPIFFSPFFPRFLHYRLIRWLCHRSSRCLEAAGAGSDPRLQCCRSDPFPHTLGIAGARDRKFWMHCRGLDPNSSPNCFFPIPGAKLVPGAGGSFAPAGPEGVREALGYVVALQ